MSFSPSQSVPAIENLASESSAIGSSSTEESASGEQSTLERLREELRRVESRARRHGWRRRRGMRVGSLQRAGEAVEKSTTPRQASAEQASTGENSLEQANQQEQTSPLSAQAKEPSEKQTREQQTHEEHVSGEQDAISSTGSSALDQLLPAGGLLRGTLVEWLSPHAGAGAGLLAWIAALEACRHDDGVLVVMDRKRRFYPPAAKRWGMNASRLMVLQPLTEADELWAMDQVLRSPAVAAVWAEFDQVSERAFRRWQLAAEEGGALGMLVRPASAARQPSWSDVQWWVKSNPLQANRTTANSATSNRTTANGAAANSENFNSANLNSSGARSTARRSSGGGWQWEITLKRCRGGTPGKRLMLEMDDVTGQLRPATVDVNTVTDVKTATAHDEFPATASALSLASQLAHPKVGRRSARA